MRTLIRWTNVVIFGLAICFLLTGSVQGAEVRSRLPEGITRPWIGPDYWAEDGKLHPDDWRLSDGRIECLDAGPGNQLHLLTRELAPHDGRLEMSLRMGRLNQRTEGFAGFLFAVTGAENEYRANLLDNKFVRAGLDGAGHLVIGDQKSAEALPESALDHLLLKMTAYCTDNRAEVSLRALASAEGEALLEFSGAVEKEPLAGNLALTCDGKARFWFRDWRVAGDKVVERPDHRFGPILWTQYTLHEGTLKMTAFMPALAEGDNQTVSLEIRRNGRWQEVARARIQSLPDPSMWRRGCATAHLRVENWDDTRDTPYRAVYRLRTADSFFTDRWEGVIRRNPVDREVVSLSVVTGMGRIAYPNHYMQQNLLAQDPDVAFFSGDQVYGASYVMFGWSFRQLLRDRPSVCTPDDHDVSANDLWGRGGELWPEGATRAFGGYRASPEFVNMIHRMQTAHLPDGYDPTPSKNGISVYYTAMDYGRVSFGIIDDRHWKSAPGQALDHPVGHDNFNNMEKVKAEYGKYDTRELDKPGLELLGERQLAFLDHWAADWRGVDMKMLLHQSPFCQSSNYGGGLWPPDLDTNGWPQSARDRALRTIRKGFAAMAGGDTHLGMLLQHGVDHWRDAGWQYVCPAGAPVSNRNWNPGFPGGNHRPDMPDYTGDYKDAFGNRMTVWAVSNPGSEFAHNYWEPDGSLVDRLQKRVAGYGIIRFDKLDLAYTFECYPIYDRLEDPAAADQYPGWPRRVPLESNYGRRATGYLPALRFQGGGRPAVQVVDETTGEIVYTRRVVADVFRPPVFGDGPYRVAVGEVGGPDVTVIEGLRPLPKCPRKVIEVEF